MSGKNWDKTIEAVDVRSNHIKLLTFQASYSLGRPGKNIESRPPSIWEPNKRLSTDMAASCCQSEIRREFLDTSKNYTSNFLTNTDRGRRTRIFEVSRLAEKLVCFAIYPRLRSGSSLELYLLTSPVIQNTFARDWICLTTVADNKVNNMDILGRSEYFGNIFSESCSSFMKYVEKHTSKVFPTSGYGRPKFWPSRWSLGEWSWPSEAKFWFQLHQTPSW